MYVVSTWGASSRCDKDQHKHAIWIENGKANFTVNEVHYAKSDKVEYSVEMSNSLNQYGDEEIVVVDTEREAWELIEDIIKESCKEANEFAFYDCETQRVVDIMYSE